MRRLVASLWVAVLVGLPSGALAQPETPTPPVVTPAPWEPPVVGAASATLVNADTGRVLYAKDADDVRAPASLTKIVTAVVARDLYALDDVVTASTNAALTRPSRLGLEESMQLSVGELLHGLLLKSGNDAAVALAEHHPNGYDGFIAAMNAKARSLGAFSSSFRNPHGLDEDGHVSSALDMAIFGRRLLADPVLAGIVSTEEHVIDFGNGTQRTLINSNKLLGTYEGVIGGKTGYTSRAGHCLWAAAHVEGGRLISVVLRSDDHYRDTRALFDYAQALALRPLEEGGGNDDAQPDPAFLAAPPAPPELTGIDDFVAPPSDPVAAPGYRWAAFVALLGAAMLVPLHRSRRPHPIQEAAQFHPFLETLAPPASRKAGAQRRRKSSAGGRS